MMMMIIHKKKKKKTDKKSKKSDSKDDDDDEKYPMTCKTVKAHGRQHLAFKCYYCCNVGQFYYKVYVYHVE